MPRRDKLDKDYMAHLRKQAERWRPALRGRRFRMSGPQCRGMTTAGALALTMAAAAAVGAGVSTAAQSGPPGDISGRVVNGATLEPVAGASVMLLTSPLPARGPLRQSTGDDGSFHHQGVPPGRYALHVTAPEYLAGGSGKQSPWDVLVPFDLVPGQRLRDVMIHVWPAGVIAGTVRDEQGEPLAFVPVRPLKLEYVAGDPVWTDVAASAQRVVTDDRGAYRFGGLEPAEYIMMAPAPAGTSGPRPIHELASQPGFSGGAWSIRDATVISLGPGERRDGVDLAVRIGSLDGYALRHQVSGRLTASAPLEDGIAVRLMPSHASNSSPGVQEFVTYADRTGRFSFASVPAGPYRLLAWQQPAAAAGTSLVGELSVDVSAGMTDLMVPMGRGSRITGRLYFEGDAPLPTPTELMQIGVVPHPVLSPTSALPEARVTAEGQFSTIGLPPGTYGLALNTRALQGWRQDHWTVDGHIVVGKGLELGRSDLDVGIRLTNRLGELAGVVRDPAGRTRPDARVIVFPRDPDKRGHGVAGAPTCVARTAPDPTGNFRVSVLPSCDLLVVAVTRPPRLWMAPDYLESLVPLGIPANIVPGGIRTMDLIARP